MVTRCTRSAILTKLELSLWNDVVAKSEVGLDEKHSAVWLENNRRPRRVRRVM